MSDGATDSTPDTRKDLRVAVMPGDESRMYRRLVEVHGEGEALLQSIIGEMQDTYVDRVIACVNACAGVPTQLLQAIANRP